MDAYGNRLTKKDLKNLFKEPPEFKSREICNIFNVDAGTLRGFLHSKTPERKPQAQTFIRNEEAELFSLIKVTDEKVVGELSAEEQEKIVSEIDKAIEFEASLPRSYTENSLDETKMLERADNFHRQFKYLYPHRPRPPLYLLNEHGVKKLTSTTLCPFKMSYPNELRDWRKCAEFVADYFDFVPFENPGHRPEGLDSLDSVFKSRKGNSLELSMILCSLLLASNYRAYVVQGYATKALCENSESEKMAPDIWYQTCSDRYEKEKASKTLNLEDLDIKAREGKYDAERVKTILDLKGRRSEYFDWMEDREAGVGQTAAEAKRKLELKEEREREMKADFMYGKRIHFWVVMCFLENGNLDSFFIESVTGEKRPTDDPEYLKIEFAWNDRNFWFSKQESVKDCGGQSFDFGDVQKWEAFLPAYKIASSAENLSLVSGEGQVLMPGTWVRGIEIRLEDVEHVFPSGKKEILYKMAKLERYNPYVAIDHLVYRMTYYYDEKRERPKKIYSYYLSRKDMLEHRITDLELGVVTERFDRLRDDALKEHVYHMNGDRKVEQDMKFYSYLRADRLGHRRWTEDWTLEEFFDREDHLASREVWYYCPGRRVSHYPSTKSIAAETDAAGENIENTEIEIEDSRSEVDEQKEEVKDVVESDELEVASPPEETEKASEPQGAVDEDLVAEAMELAMEGSLNPSSFESFEMLLEGKDFRCWTFQDFVDAIDPAERYATSDSEEEVDRKAVKEDSASDEESADEETETKQEDESTFDRLSDEELDTDYQLFLTGVREELFYVEGVDSTCLADDIKKTRKVLTDAKRRLRKKRKYRRFAQRKEFGKPSVRTYKKIMDEKSNNATEETPESLISFLDLDKKFGIRRMEELPQFTSVYAQEEKLAYALDKPEDMLKNIGRKVQSYYQNHDLTTQKYVLRIKDTFRRDPNSTLETDIECVWYFVDTESYRLDFRHPQDRVSARVVLFKKPKLKSPKVEEFHFVADLYREIMPGYECKPLGKPVLYLLLVQTMKDEPRVMEEVTELHDMVHDLLERRHEEERVLERLKEPEEEPGEETEQSYRKEELNKALYEYNREKRKHDYVAYTIEKLYFSEPLTQEEGEVVYKTIVAEFCEKADARLTQVQSQFDEVSSEYQSFLERELPTWGEGGLSPEREKKFVESCGKAYGLFLCIGTRCDTLCRSLGERYVALKRSLFKDPRLAAFIRHTTGVPEPEVFVELPDAEQDSD